MRILHFIVYALNLIYPNVCGICDKICKEANYEKQNWNI